MAITPDLLVSLTQYPDILHAEHPSGEAFDIAYEAQPEDDTPKFMIAGHVAPGRPPNYSGQTSLTIRPQDRRVLMLPGGCLSLRPGEIAGQDGY